MSRITKLMFFAITLSLIVIWGCKEQPTPDVKDVEGEPVKKSDKGADSVKSDDPAGSEEKDAALNDKKDSSVEPAANDIWMSDFETAKKKAAAENKDMLLNFTGSDWCSWCIMLEKEVFSKDEFIEEAKKDFVFVKLDFPKHTVLAAELQNQNQELNAKYKIQGYPTIFLTDANGKPYARTGYQAGGPKAYLEHIAEFQKVTELMEKAENTSLKDTERAKLLDEALNMMSPELVESYYSDLIAKIIELDSKNEAGVRDIYLAKKEAGKAIEQLQAGNTDEGIEIINKILNDYKLYGQTEQEIYYLKALAIRTKGDDAAVLENLQKAVDASPDSEMGEYIKGVIKTNFSKPEPKPEAKPALGPIPPEETTTDE